MIPYGPSGTGPDPWDNWVRCRRDIAVVESVATNDAPHKVLSLPIETHYVAVML